MSLFFVRLCSFVFSGWDGSLLAFSACVRALHSRLDSKGSMSAVFSISLTGVVFMAPRMILSPAFWTLSSLLLLVFDAVVHEVEAYSAIGLMAPV